MDDLHDSLEQEAIEQYLAEEFDPELFYRALSNALVQLKSFEGAEAA